MNKKLLEQLAGTLGLNAEELAQAIQAEGEATLELPKGKFYEDAQIETLKDNHGKTRYEAGKTAGYEMLTKELRDKSGIEITSKDPEEILNAYKKNILEEAGSKPNEKIEELNSQLEKLRSTLKEKDQELSNVKSTFQAEQRKLSIQSAMPDIPEHVGLTKEEAVSLYMNGREFKEDGIYVNGELVTDELAKPVDVSTDISGWFQTKGWGENPAGRGGGPGKGKTDGAGALPKSMEEYESYLEAKGIRAGSEEANAILHKAVAESPDSF